MQLRYGREEVVGMVREYLGSHALEDGSAKRVPINIMSMYVNTVGRKLIPKNPRAMFSTFQKPYKAAVSILQESVNQQIIEMNLARTARRTVTNALFACGVTKVGLSTPTDCSMADYRLKPGHVSVWDISLDDFVWDVHARDFSQATYMGHRFRVPLYSVVDNKLFSRQRKELSGQTDRMFNLEGDERLHMIGTGYYSDSEWIEMIDLWEIYLPQFKKVIIIADDDLTGQAFSTGGLSKMTKDDYYGKGRRKALSEQRWIGPDCGPYHVLGYMGIPGTAMYKGPIQDVFDLHLSVNEMARKLIDQAKRMKSVMPVTNAEEYERLGKTSDGEGFRRDPSNEPMKEVRFGGPDQGIGLLMNEFFNMASKLGGNLELIGGQGPQARTATQDKMANANAGAGIQAMQDDTNDYLSSVIGAIGWFEHYHPTKIHRTEFAAPGVPDASITRESYPNNPAVHQNVPGRVVRAHRYEDMQITVDPYSLQHHTPQERAAMLMQAIQQVYMPMAQQCQQAGIAISMPVLFKKLGEYWDMPDLDELFTISTPNIPDEQPSADQPQIPGQSETIHTRRSVGDQSQQAKEALISNAMSKGSGQPGPMGGGVQAG